VLPGDVSDEEEAKSGAFDARHCPTGDSVEAIEDAFELAGVEAHASVGDGEGDPGVVGDGEGAADVDAFRGVFDGVVEDVDDGGTEVFDDAHGAEADGAGNRFENDAARRQMMALEGYRDAVFDERAEVDEGSVLLTVALSELSGFEDLLDCGEEAIGVGEHNFVELLFLLLGGCATLEGFEVEPDAGDGGFQLVGDGVEEGVLTFVAADFADEEDGVEDDSGDDEREEDGAEDGEGDGTLVADDPANIESDEAADDKRAEGDEKSDGSASSGNVHDWRKYSGGGFRVWGRAAGTDKVVFLAQPLVTWARKLAGRNMVANRGR
jgi:hypothetical protein